MIALHHQPSSAIVVVAKGRMSKVSPATIAGASLNGSSGSANNREPVAAAVQIPFFMRSRLDLSLCGSSSVGIRVENEATESGRQGWAITATLGSPAAPG